jgi:hypothetical protein
MEAQPLASLQRLYRLAAPEDGRQQRAQADDARQDDDDVEARPERRTAMPTSHTPTRLAKKHPAVSWIGTVSMSADTAGTRRAANEPAVLISHSLLATCCPRFWCRVQMQVRKVIHQGTATVFLALHRGEGHWTHRCRTPGRR